MTQEEIGRRLGCCQTSVHKALYGNLVYSGPDAGKRFGGLFRKMARLAIRNSEIRDLLERLAEAETDMGIAVRRGRAPHTRRHLRPGDSRWEQGFGSDI